MSLQPQLVVDGEPQTEDEIRTLLSQMGEYSNSVTLQEAGRCIILASHRASTIDIADRVYTIENGVVTRQR